MIDYFSLALMHGLLLVGLVRILGRDELDHEDVLTHAEADAAIRARDEAGDPVVPRNSRERHRRDAGKGSRA